METPNTSKTVKDIESEYGPYARNELRNDIGSFLIRRYQDDEKCLLNVLRAIKERQAIRFGPPDVATIVEAVKNYEDQYGIKIQRSPIVFEAPTESEIEETRIDCKKMAEERGIDTSKEGWMIVYLTMIMKERE